jgi:hypothetical protein
MAAATGVPPRVITGPGMQQPLSGQTDHSVFDILKIFRVWWFLLQDSIISNIILAQKDPDSAYTWVELTSQYYSYLIRLALRLIPQLLELSLCVTNFGLLIIHAYTFSLLTLT